MNDDSKHVARGRSPSKLDKDIMRLLLSPDGNNKKTSKAIAKVLGVSTTTVQRHRRRLENELLTVNYGLDLTEFGWHRVQFFVSIGSGKIAAIAKEMARLNQVVSVDRSIGQQSIDLHVEAVIKDNEDILDVLEKMRGMAGVTDVVWSEKVQVMSRKSSVPPHVIDKL